MIPGIGEVDPPKPPMRCRAHAGPRRWAGVEDRAAWNSGFQVAVPQVFSAHPRAQARFDRQTRSSHGCGSSSTHPSACRIWRPQARDGWPEGNGSAGLIHAILARFFASKSLPRLVEGTRIETCLTLGDWEHVRYLVRDAEDGRKAYASTLIRDLTRRPGGRQPRLSRDTRL